MTAQNPYSHSTRNTPDASHHRATTTRKEKAEADIDAVKSADTYIAVYTAAKAQFAADQQQGGIGLLGCMTTSKPVNAPGDKVTFTAAPFEGHTFKNWTAADGSVAGTNPVLTITAKGGELYTAHFQ